MICASQPNEDFLIRPRLTKWKEEVNVMLQLPTLGFAEIFGEAAHYSANTSASAAIRRNWP